MHDVTLRLPFAPEGTSCINSFHMPDDRPPVPFCRNIDQLYWPFSPWNSGWHFIWSVSGLLCLWSTTLRCISSLPAAVCMLVATQPDLLSSAPAEVCFCCVPDFYVVSPFLVTLSPLIAGALLSRLPKIMFPTKCCCLYVVWRSVPFCLPVTAQARITLAFIHLFFNCIACSYLICYHLGASNMIAL